MQLQNDAKSHPGESDVKFRLAKDTLDTMLRSMYCIRDQLSNMVLHCHSLYVFLTAESVSLPFGLSNYHLLFLLG